MIVRVLSATVCGPHHLLLAFNDGESGVADVRPLMTGPIFEPLHEPEFFALGELDPVAGAVAWPNGADFAPEALRAVLQPAGLVPVGA